MDWKDEESDVNDYPTEFIGPCTCEHPRDDHGWLECDVDDCECEAHWEE